MKSLGGGYTLYRKGNVIAVSKEGNEIAEFPAGSDLIDLLVNPYSEQFMKIREKLTCLENELHETPSGYRNSQDIKILKDRVEKFGVMKAGDVASFDRRINSLEELLQSGKNVTVHSRLNDMEQEIAILTRLKQDLESTSCSNYFVQETHNHSTSIAHLERKMNIAETNNCKNVASIKAMEERLDRIDKNMNIIDMEWHKMRDGLTGIVRNILKSL